jgi:phage/plasmid-associated DNA primase
MQEPSKGDKINEGIMKQVTGGDPLQARAPYMPETISFVPQFKLVVCSNEFMEIKSQDHGTWRRIRVVDFESLFTETPKNDDPDKPYQFKLDKYLKDKFDYWKEIFAGMLVENAFKTEGLVEDCPKVLASSNSYRVRQDYLAEFIQERVFVCKHSCVPKTQLNVMFKEWYGTNYGGKTPNPKELITYMDKFSGGKLTNGVWQGVKLKYETDNGSENGSRNHNQDMENDETTTTPNIEDDIGEIQLEEL